MRKKKKWGILAGCMASIMLCVPASAYNDTVTANVSGWNATNAHKKQNSYNFGTAKVTSGLFSDGSITASLKFKRNDKSEFYSDSKSCSYNNVELLIFYKDPFYKKDVTNKDFVLQARLNPYGRVSAATLKVTMNP